MKRVLYGKSRGGEEMSFKMGNKTEERRLGACGRC